MICPVGALTSQVYRFRARPWDNEPTNSTCTLCPVGCSMIFDSRDGEIMRTRSLENHSLNDIWLCDKGWFGYEFVTNNERLNQPLIRKNNKLEPATWEEAITLIANKYQAAKNSGKVAGIGGHPLTVEENYLFQKLIRDGAGVGNVDYRVGMPIFSLEEEGIQPGMEIEIGDTANLQYAFLFGIDLTEEFPVIWLRLRHSINNGAKVIFAGHFAPEIEAYLAKTVLHNPGQEIEIIKQQFADLSSFKGKGAIFVGRQYLNSPNRKAILAELLKFKQSGANISLNLLEGKGNSTGSRFAGMHPEIGPDGATLAKPGLNINKVFETAAASGWDILHVAGANPAGKYPSKLWKQVREKLGFLIVQDIFLNETAAEADVVLPTLSYVEKGGHFITIEGRVQTLQPGKIVPDELYSDADIFAQIAGKLNVTLTIDNEFLQKLKPGILTFARPNTLNATATTAKTNGLLGTFTPALFDHGVRMKHDPKVLELSKPPKLRLHPVEANKYNLKNDDKLALTVNGNTIHGQVKIDDKVSQNTVVIPLGFEDVLPVHELGINLLNGIPVEVKKA
jgi:NADH-quinone oxidoreductase subunit G